MRIKLMDVLDEAILGMSDFDSSKIPPERVAFARGHVCVDQRDPSQGWSDRLREIYTRACEAADQIQCDPKDVIDAMLRSDGWVINKRTIKTPHWMPHHEVSTKKAAGYFGLEWLREYT